MKKQQFIVILLIIFSITGIACSSSEKKHEQEEYKKELTKEVYLGKITVIQPTGNGNLKIFTDIGNARLCADGFFLVGDYLFLRRYKITEYNNPGRPTPYDMLYLHTKNDEQECR